MTRELYKLLSVMTDGGSSVKSQTKYIKIIQTPFTFDQSEHGQMDDFSTTTTKKTQTSYGATWTGFKWIQTHH